ncbi:MAG: hypothetical protein ACRC2V_00355, partial [Xenococcaceae cyanobacterium]
LNFILTGIQSVTASTGNRWLLTLDRLSQPGTTATTIATFSTATPTVFAANAITTVVYPINTLIDVATSGIKALKITESRATGNSTKHFSYILQYKIARP